MSEIDTECWEWQGHLHANGYGRLTNKRKTQYAHRFMYESFYGEIPEGMDVCHKCDNRKCVNPNHLFLGSRKDNMRDAMIKGRLQRGEERYNSVLNEEIVRKARKLRDEGLLVKEIANRFGVEVHTMGNAIRRKTWRHVA